MQTKTKYNRYWPLCGDYYTGFGSRKNSNSALVSMSKIKKEKVEKCREKARDTLFFCPKSVFFHFIKREDKCIDHFSAICFQSGPIWHLCLFVCVTMGIGHIEYVFKPNNRRWIPSDNTFYYTFLNIDSAMINTLTETRKNLVWHSLSLSFHFSCL